MARFRLSKRQRSLYSQAHQYIVVTKKFESESAKNRYITMYDSIIITIDSTSKGPYFGTTKLDKKQNEGKAGRDSPLEMRTAATKAVF